jgi:hypothetical protein
VVTAVLVMVIVAACIAGMVQQARRDRRAERGHD